MNSQFQNFDLMLLRESELGDKKITAYFRNNPDASKSLRPILDEDGLLRYSLLKLLGRTDFPVATIILERIRELVNDEKTDQADRIEMIHALLSRSGNTGDDAAKAFLVLYDLHKKPGRKKNEELEIIKKLIFKLEHIETEVVVAGLHEVLAALTTETKSKFYSWLIEHGTMWKEILTKAMFKVPIDDHPTTFINS